MIQADNFRGFTFARCETGEVPLRVELAIDFECSRIEVARPLADKAREVPDVAIVVIVDHELNALAHFVGAEEHARVDTPIGLAVDQQLEVTEFLVGQEDATISRTGWILLSGERTVFDSPVPTRAMVDSPRVRVPSDQRFTIEKASPLALRGV